MKHLIMTLLAIGILFGSCFADEGLTPKDQKDKDSYSLGYQFGQYLKSQGIDINLDVYTSAIKDALGDKESLMSKEEIRTTIKGLEQRVKTERQKPLKEQAAKNLEESKRFLAENQRKEGIKALPSGLQYMVLAEGSGKIPQATDSVTVNYKGTLIDGTEFDSSYKRGQPTTFKVTSVIKGWTEALQLMKEGSKWQLFIPPDLAYGERATGRNIPPNSTLIFDVELIGVK